MIVESGLLPEGLQLHQKVLVGVGIGVLAHANRLIAHARAILTEAALKVNLGTHYQLHGRFMQSVHGQILDSIRVLMHLEEFACIDPENRLSDFAEAAKRDLTAAIAHLDREVVGGDVLFRGAHAGLAVIAHARAVLNHLFLANLTCQVKHLPIGRLWHKDPGEITVQIAVEWFATTQFSILLHLLLELRNQESWRLRGPLLLIATSWGLTEGLHFASQLAHRLSRRPLFEI